MNNHSQFFIVPLPSELSETLRVKPEARRVMCPSKPQDGLSPRVSAGARGEGLVMVELEIVRAYEPVPLVDVFQCQHCFAYLELPIDDESEPCPICAGVEVKLVADL
jgi:hypothetical protein